MRLETANGLTLETELRKLKSYLESRRADWREATEDFEAWATIYTAGALRNLAAGVAVFDTGSPRLCSTCGKGRRYGGLTLCYSCQTHG